MVDYGIALKRPFSDWKKLAIGSSILLGFVLLGFIIVIPFSIVAIFNSNIILRYIPSLIQILIFAIPTAYFVICGLTAFSVNKSTLIPIISDSSLSIRTRSRRLFLSEKETKTSRSLSEPDSFLAYDPNMPILYAFCFSR